MFEEEDFAIEYVAFFSFSFLNYITSCKKNKKQHNTRKKEKEKKATYSIAKSSSSNM